jgi:hypothetical protein
MIYIVWCKSPFGTDLMTVWEERHLAERETQSLNKRDPEAFYFVEALEISTSLN